MIDVLCNCKLQTRTDGRCSPESPQGQEAMNLRQWLIPRVASENLDVPGSRLARVCGTPGGALVVWPSTPGLINWLPVGRGNPKSQAFFTTQGGWAVTIPLRVSRWANPHAGSAALGQNLQRDYGNLTRQ